MLMLWMNIVPSLGTCTLAVVIPAGAVWVLLSRVRDAEARNRKR